MEEKEMEMKPMEKYSEAIKNTFFNSFILSLSLYSVCLSRALTFNISLGILFFILKTSLEDIGNDLSSFSVISLFFNHLFLHFSF